MTSPVTEAITRAETEGRAALVGYLPAGFPNVTDSVEALVALANGGADVIELGIPYSDPVMDGVVIQRATNRALENGFRVAQVFDIIKQVTERTDVPILVMTYWNPVVQYGIERFAVDLKSAGGAGLITPDLIPDEATEWLAVSDRLGLDRVFLAAPSSTDERLKQAVVASRGFVYAVSTMGITGQRDDLDAAAKTLVSRLRDCGAHMVCVGVGVSSPAHVASVGHYANGAIVGSLLVNALDSEGPEGVLRATRELAAGTPRTAP